MIGIYGHECETKKGKKRKHETDILVTNIGEASFENVFNQFDLTATSP